MAGVTFLDVLWSEAQHARTLWLLLLASVAFVSKVVALDRPRYRALVSFLAAHLACLLATAALAAFGSPLHDLLRTPTWVLGAALAVTSGALLLFNVVMPRLGLHAPLIVRDVIVVIAQVSATVLVLSRSGFNLQGLIATSAVFSAILGFSLQDVIGNIAGGLALQVDGSLSPGDWIRVDQLVGRIVEVRWRHTAIETRDWETVLIPNSIMTKSNVVILGRRRGGATQQRRHIYFTVDFKHQPGDVINVVNTAVRAAQLPNVALTPLPYSAMNEMVNAWPQYVCRYWLTDLAADTSTDSAVRACIYFALHRAGMELSSHASAVNLAREEDHEHREVKTEKQLRRRRELLNAFPLFASLADEERDELARALVYAPFARGEVMTRQGAEAHWLYLLEEGEGSVRVSDGTQQREVSRLKAPAFFGEMSLLTGEPRSATVLAETDVECFRLDKVAVGRVLTARPELAGQLALTLAERRLKLDSVRETMSADAAKERAAREANALKDRIRAFFAME